MKMNIIFQEKSYQINLDTPIDISIPLQSGVENPNCFWSPMPSFEPVRVGSFVGATSEGGSVNFKNVFFNPHGNGTHTECVGHIAAASYTINQCLKKFHFFAKLATIYPQIQDNGDRVVEKSQIEAILKPNEAEALIIRTMPNDNYKLKTNYSGANPPYISAEAMQYIVACGIKHFLIDLPSVDREEDAGALAAHKAFWQYPDTIRTESTITELIFVPNYIKDNFYLLHISIASFELDASPSKPVLYGLDSIP
jgi:arylformamidase